MPDTRTPTTERPLLPPAVVRRHVQSFKVSDLEQAELAARAARAGLRIADYLRAQLGWPPSHYGTTHRTTRRPTG